MDDRKLLGIGAAGTLIAALFCLTPLLVILLAAIGLSGIVGWLDYVLLPALGLFVVLTVYAVIRRRRRGSARAADPGP